MIIPGYICYRHITKRHQSPLHQESPIEMSNSLTRFLEDDCLSYLHEFVYSIKSLTEQNRENKNSLKDLEP